jgi:serine/threonine protein kinase
MESKYRVEKCIGRGNYGTVYLVRSIANKKHYVLKRINYEHMPAKDRDHVAVEVQMLSRLNHPNIVTYKDHMEDDQNLFIIMGYCEDGDLHTKIKVLHCLNGSSRVAVLQEASRAGIHFSEEQILKWFVQMVMALK